MIKNRLMRYEDLLLAILSAAQKTSSLIAEFASGEDGIEAMALMGAIEPLKLAASVVQHCRSCAWDAFPDGGDARKTGGAQ